MDAFYALQLFIRSYFNFGTEIKYFLSTNLWVLFAQANTPPLTDSAEKVNFVVFFLVTISLLVGTFIIARLIGKRLKIQRYVLQKKVEQRTAEINKQKEALEEQSEKLQKAYEEIKTKNMAIEEAFEHLSNSYSKMSDLNREKDGMMSIVAHDLRTPLNNIEGLIQLVSMDGNLNADQKDYIGKIRTVVKHGNELIRDLLDINQAKNKKANLNITHFSILEFMDEWKVHFEKPMHTKDQKLNLNIDFQEVMVNTDAGLLSRIMNNLMSNALKFSDKGTTVHIAITEENQNEIKIEMKDEGPGISESDQKKMFKPFTRLSARPTDGEPSNGLGLSIIKSLVKQLKGKIEVSSTLGEGTTFQIVIPKTIEVVTEQKKTAVAS